MISLVAPIFALLSGVGFVLLGTGLLNTLLALRGVSEGFSSVELGIIMSSYFAGYLVGTMVSTRIISRAGYIRAFAFSAALLAASVLLHSLWVNPLAWIVLRVITGVAVVTLYTTIESWLNRHSTSENRGKVFSIYMGVNLGALALTQQFILIAPIEGTTLFIISALLVILALLPVTLTRLTQPQVPKQIKISLRATARVAPLATVASGISGLAMGAFWGMLAVFASRLEMDRIGVAGFMTMAILGGAVLQMPIGRWSDKQDRRQVMFYVSLLAVASGLLLAVFSLLASGVWALMAAAIFIYGGFAFAIYPISVAHLVDHTEPDDVLAACASALLVHGACAAIGPALAGQFMTLWGPIALPLYFMATHLLLALLIYMELRSPFILLRKGAHLAHFIPMLRTTPVAMEMYPEAEEVQEEDPPENHSAAT